MIVVRWPIVILIAGMTAAYAAPDGAAIRLSLTEAERRWQEHDREMRQAALAVRGAEADLVATVQTPNPQLSLNVLSISPNEGFGAGNLHEKKMDSILRLEQLIERGDKRELRSQSAEAKLEAARRDLDWTRRQQRLALHNAYFEPMLAQEKKRFSEDTASLYASSLRAGDARLNAEDISRNDHSRLRVEKLRAENDARQSIADYGQAQVALAYLVGLESRADALVAEDGWPELDAEPAPASAIGQIAQRPDIRVAQARTVAAEAARDLARSLISATSRWACNSNTTCRMRRAAASGSALARRFSCVTNTKAKLPAPRPTCIWPASRWKNWWRWRSASAIKRATGWLPAPNASSGWKTNCWPTPSALPKPPNLPSTRARPT